MLRMLRTVIVSVLVFTILTGIIYPVVVTGIVQLMFPKQANGDLIIKSGKAVGSALIGQSFDRPEYFWGRLSATLPFPYNSASSSGSNLAETNPGLLKNIQRRIDALRAADPTAGKQVPIDLVTASGSGLDPHISLVAAEYQAGRVARARSLDEATVRSLILQFAESRQFGIMGEPRVNVLMLNLALDGQ